MKIRIKISLMFIGIIAMIVAINYGVLTRIVLDSFRNLEEKETVKLGSKLTETFNAELEYLNSKVGDWANWDDSYAFLQGKNTNFLSVNLQDETLSQLSLSMIQFINAKGEIVYTKMYDIQASQPLPETSWWKNYPLPLDFSPEKDSKKNLLGVVTVDSKPMLISARQSLTSDGSGPAVGFVVFGRFLDSKLVENFTLKQKNPVESRLFNPEEVETEYKLAQTELETKTIFVHTESEELIEAYVLIRDIYNKPSFILRESIRRDIYLYGKNSTNLFALFISTITSFAAFATFIFVDRQVLSRVSKLSNEVKKIGNSGNMTERVASYGKDEIGELAISFNEAIDQLENISLAKLYQERQSESLLNVMEEGVVVTNELNKITYVNPAFQKLFGFAEDESKGKELSELLHFFEIHGKVLPPGYLDDIAKRHQNGKSVTIRIQGKNTAIPTLVTTASIIVQKEYKGVIRVFHDVTTQIELEQQKDDFFSIASHELRTPLTVISGNLDNVIEGYGKSSLSDVDKKSLQDAMESSDRLIRLVKDYLNVSRLEQGRFVIENSPVDACVLVEKVQHEMKPLFDKKNLALNFICDKSHGKISADEDKLKEILVNLIGNSLKFTKQGSITVAHSVENTMLVTRITDTGMGIEPEKQHLLFARFQQAMKQTIAREAGGSGLGLYISREFVRLMGGDMWLVGSELGKGSTFAFSIPLLEKNS